MKWLLHNWVPILITSIIILIIHFLFGDKITAMFKGQQTTDNNTGNPSKTTMPAAPVVYPKPLNNQKLQALANLNVRTSPNSIVSSNIAFTVAKNDTVGIFVGTAPAEPMSPAMGTWYQILPINMVIANPNTTYYVYADLVKPI